MIAMIIFQVGCGKDNKSSSIEKNDVLLSTEAGKDLKSTQTTDKNKPITDPTLIDKETLEYYKVIAINKNLSEEELRKVVAKLLDSGLSPDRVYWATENGGIISIKDKPGYISYIKEVQIYVDEREKILKDIWVNTMSGHISLYHDGTTEHHIDDFFVSEEILDKVNDEVKKYAKLTYEKDGYKFDKDLQRRYSNLEENKETKEILFFEQNTFEFNRELYGGGQERKEQNIPVLYDSNGNIINIEWKPYKIGA